MPREMHSGTMADDSRMIVFGGRGTEQQVIMDKQSQCCSWGFLTRQAVCQLLVPLNTCVCLQVLSDVSLFDADSMTWQQHQETDYPRCAHTAVAMQQGMLHNDRCCSCKQELRMVSSSA